METRVHIADVPVVAMAWVFFDGMRAGSVRAVDPSDRLRAPAGASAAYSGFERRSDKTPLLEKVRCEPLTTAVCACPMELAMHK